MFKTFQGVTEDTASRDLPAPRDRAGHLRQLQKRCCAPRAASCPLGIAQIGKSFRNEITPGNFTFRTREFEQMELEFFCKPGDGSGMVRTTGKIPAQNFLSVPRHEPTSIFVCATMRRRSFRIYSKATTDIEYLFPFGWGELWGIADRTDYDLKQHQNHSGESMEYYDDPTTNEKYHSLLRSSRRSAPTASRSPSLCDAYRRGARLKTATPAWSCTCIRRWRRSRPPSFRCQKKARALPAGESTRALAKRLHGGLRRGRLHRQALSPPG